jgi:DNA-binding NarL/FixJ family response regulator
MRVCVVCSDLLLHAGLSSLLEQVPEVDLARTDGSVASANRLANHLSAIVICSDALSPVEFAELSQLRSSSSISVIAISTTNEAQIEPACSFADRSVARHLGYGALRKALLSLSGPIKEKKASGNSKRSRSLTKRETEVGRLIARGHSNRQIGLELGLREQSVKNLTSTIMRKLLCENRVQVALRFAERAKIAG